MSSKVLGIEGKYLDTEYIVMEFTYNGVKFDDLMQTVNMGEAFDTIKRESGVTLHGLIGNDFMQRFKYVLDFKDMIAYSRL